MPHFVLKKDFALKITTRELYIWEQRCPLAVMAPFDCLISVMYKVSQKFNVTWRNK